MEQEAEFIRLASEEFAREYERETGHRLRFRTLADAFPDAILETCEGVERGAEFVSVVLPFIWQEEEYFNKYRERFLEVLQPSRPRYKHVAVRLQLCSNIVEGHRPYRLPDLDGDDGKSLVGEFCDLLARHFDALRGTYGGLIEDIAVGGPAVFPTLLKYFSAVIINPVTEHDPRKRHPQDPIIEPVGVTYLSGEIAKAVRAALATKARKGRAYASDILVLHTLPTPGKRHFPGTAMDAAGIQAFGRELLTEYRDLCDRFEEIWFLNAYWTEGRRLYQLK